MKTFFKPLLLSSLLAVTAVANAGTRVAIMIGSESVDKIENFQEYAAASHFVESNPDGVVIAPGETSKINLNSVDCIWIHVDRVGIGHGNLPAEFSDEATLKALSQFVADGGALLLTKQATQMVSLIGRIPASFNPNIYGDGDGGEGLDDWTINAHIGWWFGKDSNDEHYDPSQYYNRTGHAMYKDIEPGMYNDFICETFPMEGTGNPETSLWREDHNCVWDLNALTYTADGANTVEKFENDLKATVVGTWGHVVDHAVAGIVEFLPTDAFKGRIIANGLSTYEWAPRTGVNAYHDNIKKLTDNSMSYLVKGVETSVIDNVATAVEAEEEWYTLSGVRVSGSALAPGVYVVRQGGKSVKRLVK